MKIRIAKTKIELPDRSSLEDSLKDASIDQIRIDNILKSFDTLTKSLDEVNSFILNREQLVQSLSKDESWINSTMRMFRNGEITRAEYLNELNRKLIQLGHDRMFFTYDNPLTINDIVKIVDEE